MGSFFPCRRLAFIIAVFLAGAIPDARADVGYTFTKLNLPVDYYLLGMNDSGQIAGCSVTHTTGNDIDSPFLYDRNSNSFTPIQQQGLPRNCASAINNSGFIVISYGGSYIQRPSDFGEAIYSLVSKTFFRLPSYPPAATCSFFISSINNNHLMAGLYSANNCFLQAFIYDSQLNSYRYVGEGGISKINDSGLALGLHYASPGGNFLYDYNTGTYPVYSYNGVPIAPQMLNNTTVYGYAGQQYVAYDLASSVARPWPSPKLPEDHGSAPVMINNLGDVIIQAGSDFYFAKAPNQTPIPPVAVNEAGITDVNSSVVIDLKQGAVGNPTSASLVGTPLNGTVSGFPGTSVTFTPPHGFTGMASFKFSLSNSLGTSAPATAAIAVLPKVPSLFSQETKAQLIQIGSSMDDVSRAFDIAAIVSEGEKRVVKNLSTSLAMKAGAILATNNDALGQPTADLALSITKFSIDAGKQLTKANVFSRAMDFNSLAFATAALVVKLAAADPPDSQYKTVYKPKPVKFPSTGNTTNDKILGDYAAYTSLMIAVYHASEKWQGATLAGDAKSATLQKNAFTGYSQQAASVKSLLQADNQVLAQSLSAISINSYPGGASALAAAFNNMCGKPLAKSLNDKLLALSYSQADIDQAVCKAASSVTPADITADFAHALSTTLP